MLLRWDLRNIIPLTFDEHRLVHDGMLQFEILNPFRKQFLLNQKNKGLKTYLLEEGLTVEEFLKQSRQKIMQELGL